MAQGDSIHEDWNTSGWNTTGLVHLEGDSATTSNDPEHRFFLLTVTRMGEELIAFPRPASVSFPVSDSSEPLLDESTCTFDARFRGAVESVWTILRAVLPEETAGRRLELRVKARGDLGGGSIGLPLMLASLGALLDQPLPASLYATGLAPLADGFFTGQLLQDIQAKAKALVPLAARHDGEATFAIPAHRQVPLPPAEPGVQYLPVAHVGQILDRLFPSHQDRVATRLAACWTLQNLPFDDEIRAAFRDSDAVAVALECTAFEPGPLTIEVTEEPWGRTVWVDYPGLPGGGTMVYRFDGETLVDKEHFGDPAEARAKADTLHLGPAGTGPLAGVASAAGIGRRE